MDSTGIACNQCTGMHAGKTRIHIEQKIKSSKKRGKIVKLFLCVCGSVHHMYQKRPEEGVISARVRITDDFELLDICAGNQTRDLWKSSKLS